jgi:hypothetical protein
MDYVNSGFHHVRQKEFIILIIVFCIVNVVVFWIVAPCSPVREY